MTLCREEGAAVVKEEHHQCHHSRRDLVRPTGIRGSLSDTQKQEKQDAAPAPETRTRPDCRDSSSSGRAQFRPPGLQGHTRPRTAPLRPLLRHKPLTPSAPRGTKVWPSIKCTFQASWLAMAPRRPCHSHGCREAFAPGVIAQVFESWTQRDGPGWPQGGSWNPEGWAGWPRGGSPQGPAGGRLQSWLL